MPKNFPVNLLSEALHPEKQFVTITDIKVWDENCKSFTFTAELIKKYAPSDGYSIFLCGPAGMYNFLDQQIQTLRLEQKWIRHELQGEIHNLKQLPDYPKNRNVPETVSITVIICDEQKTITASTDDTVLQALEKNGISTNRHRH